MLTTTFNPVESKAIERMMAGCRLGAKVYHYDILESTQIEAKRLAQEGTPEGTLVIARTQTKGYGRQGAFWHSAPGGLWFSLVLYPKFAPTEAEAFSLQAAEAVKKTLEGFCPKGRFIVKPPNDILAWIPAGVYPPWRAGMTEQKKKVCGILAEGGIQDDRYRWLILGIGINVDNDLPEELKTQAANLKELSGHPIPRMPLLKKLLEDLTTLR